MASTAQRGAARPRAATGPLEMLRRHGDHSSGFLTLNQGMDHHVAAGIDGYVAYRPAGRRELLALCGPVAAAADKGPLLRSFLQWADTCGRRVTAVQLTREDAALYARHGFGVDQLGASYSIDLTRFTLHGTRFMRARNKIKRASRGGVTIAEWEPGELRSPAAQAGLAEVDRTWLRAKGRHVKELGFMVGERGGPAADERRLFVASLAGRPIAYATYSPCFGGRPGWLYDLTRRRPDAPAGTVELLFSTALELLRDEGCEWLHLGHTPMVQLAPRHRPAVGSSALVAGTLRLLERHGEAIYPAHSQERFKLKWAPHLIEPEYIGFRPRVSPGAVWCLLRTTRAI